MEYLLAYGLFSITTGFTAIYELLHPVVVKQRTENKVVEHTYLIYPVFFIIFVLTAPIGFLSCIIPSWGIIFRETLQTALFSDQ